MRTTNGLDVPTGWGRAVEVRHPCPVCFHATTVVTNAAGYRALADHARRGRPQCAGSGRLVE